MTTLHIDLVAGARPNFIKLAPVHEALRSRQNTRLRIVHTGQHYDEEMSEVFFRDLTIPEPDVYLEVGSAAAGAQTARILERYEATLLRGGVDATVVFGDVNSTVACTLAAAKLGIPTIHVEAGLRSFDRSMPEEINRLVTDTLSDLLLVSERSGLVNLSREGISDERVRFVGNVMIDSLEKHSAAARELRVFREFGVEAENYAFVTLHRPSNVDAPETLARLLRLLRELSNSTPVVFAVHPRTKQAIETHSLDELLAPIPERFFPIAPQTYLRSVSLMADAKVVLTDSGGMQEETTHLGTPCLTLRDNTERPVTIELGTNRLVGNDPARVLEAFNDLKPRASSTHETVPLWDGRASERVADEVIEFLNRRRASS